MDRNYLYEQWLVDQKGRARKKRRHSKPFIGERGYPHLDNKLFYPKVGNDAAHAALLAETVTNPEKLKHHPFLPFIKNGKRQRKYRQPPHDYVHSSVRGQRDQKKFPYIKNRPIMFAGHKDASIFSYFGYCLEQLYESELTGRDLQGNVIAYRSIDGKSNVDFAKDGFLELKARTEFDCIMVDVKSFFDTIDHKLLLGRWNTLIPGGFKANPDHKIIYDRITSYRYLDFNESVQILRGARRKYVFREKGCLKLCKLADYNKYLKKTVRENKSGTGIPQGSPISGILANIYLLDFDQAMRKLIVDTGGLYQRYSDDIFIVCGRGKGPKIYNNLKAMLAVEKLKLGTAKTEAFRKDPSHEGLQNITVELEAAGKTTRREAQYLGFHFNGQHIVLRPSTLAKHIRKGSKAGYLTGAYNKTRDERLARQINNVRRFMKKA